MGFFSVFKKFISEVQIVSKILRVSSVAESRMSLKYDEVTDSCNVKRVSFSISIIIFRMQLMKH